MDQGAHGTGSTADYKLKESDEPGGLRPFVGLAPNVPASVAFFLQEQDYILDTCDTTTRRGVFISGGTLSRLTNQVQLVDYVEASASSLIRYWRWLNGAQRAMCVTGGLDALTLLDSASRLFAR